VKRVRILIMENDPLLSSGLNHLLNQYGYEVSGICTTADGAVLMAKEVQPDLIIADINLDGEKTGIDAVHQIKKDLRDLMVIYLTVEDDRHIFDQAGETFPDNYIIKPYSKRGVIYAIYNAIRNFKRRASQPPLPSGQSIAGNHLFIKGNQHRNMNIYSRIEIDHVLYIEADGAYCKIHMDDKTQHHLSMTTKDLEHQLNGTSIVRVHRSYLVNLNKVIEISKEDRLLYFGKDKKVSYSRERTAELGSWFHFLERL